MRIKNGLVLAGAIFVLLASSAVWSQSKRWVLPVADADSHPSPPSVHGFVVGAAAHTLTVKPDLRDETVQAPVKVQLAAKTDYFTAAGGAYDQKDLRAGQYVWVWYITADPSKAGTPPRAAVVMLWSEDPKERPSKSVRWSYDKNR